MIDVYVIIDNALSFWLWNAVETHQQHTLLYSVLSLLRVSVLCVFAKTYRYSEAGVHRVDGRWNSDGKFFYTPCWCTEHVLGFGVRPNFFLLLWLVYIDESLMGMERPLRRPWYRRHLCNRTRRHRSTTADIEVGQLDFVHIYISHI